MRVAVRVVSTQVSRILVVATMRVSPLDLTISGEMLGTSVQRRRVSTAEADGPLVVAKRDQRRHSDDFHRSPDAAPATCFEGKSLSSLAEPVFPVMPPVTVSRYAKGWSPTSRNYGAAE